VASSPSQRLVSGKSRVPFVSPRQMVIKTPLEWRRKLTLFSFRLEEKGFSVESPNGKKELLFSTRVVGGEFHLFHFLFQCSIRTEKFPLIFFPPPSWRW